MTSILRCPAQDAGEDGDRQAVRSHVPDARTKRRHAIREVELPPKSLAGEILEREEMKNKVLAVKLHEEVAQSLSAIKVSLEQGLAQAPGSDMRDSLKETVPALQAAIRQIQALAMELRPSGLDDFGLVPTLRWVCREFERTHPAVSVNEVVCVPADYPFGHLAIVIYRVVESALAEIARVSETDRISLSLQIVGRWIEVTIDDSSSDAGGQPRRHADMDPRMRFASVRERTILSGGTFSATRNATGGITAQAAWAVSAAQAVTGRTARSVAS